MGKIVICGENEDPLGTPQDSGVWKIREIRSFERLEELGDSGDFGGKSLNMAKIENLFERRRNREIGKLGNSGDSEFGGTGRK